MGLLYRGVFRSLSRRLNFFLPGGGDLHLLGSESPLNQLISQFTGPGGGAEPS